MTGMIFPEQDFKHLQIFAKERSATLKKGSLHCLEKTCVDYSPDIVQISILI
jgi:hypothetical protein